MPSSRGSSSSRVYKYIIKQEILGQGESTCSSILSMTFMLVVQTSLCTFQLTTLPRLPVGPETKSKFFYLPLWSHLSPYLTRRHSLLHPMASGPLHLHFFLPNTPCQLLLNLQVATLVSLSDADTPSQQTLPPNSQLFENGVASNPVQAGPRLSTRSLLLAKWRSPCICLGAGAAAAETPGLQSQFDCFLAV